MEDLFNQAEDSSMTSNPNSCQRINTKGDQLLLGRLHLIEDGNLLAIMAVRK